MKYPNEKIMKEPGGIMKYPNEKVMKAPESLMKYPNEIVMKEPRGIMKYPNEKVRSLLSSTDSGRNPAESGQFPEFRRNQIWRMDLPN